MEEPLDLFVIGGGVNGVGIARDAAGRGLRVALCEKGDLGGGTSSASTKLIHGGLRYLERYEFQLVREALREREVLLRSAPHIVKPLRFVLPHHAGLRPAWMLRLGLFLYDRLGGRARGSALTASRAVDLRREAAGAPLQERYRKGFAYSDCRVDDARLVALNAVDAAERGAEICTRARFVEAAPAGGVWRIVTRDAAGAERLLRARILVNASGPWLARVRQAIRLPAADHESGATPRLVKGSHILVRRLFAGEHAYLFQQGDGRVVFAIPYQDRYTLIGTTEAPYEGSPDEVAISDEEKEYLCAAVNGYFQRAIGKDDIVGHYSGVRPLFGDEEREAAALSRDYALGLSIVRDAAGEAGDAAETDSVAEGATLLLSVYGGKITTYRKLAEAALAKLAPYLPACGPAWTAQATLPGGDMPGADFAGFCERMRRRYAWLPPPTLARLLDAYGTRVERILGAARAVSELGVDFGHGLHEAELRYLVEHEWAREVDDVLWRRAKLGLAFSAAETRRVREWLRAVDYGQA